MLSFIVLSSDGYSDCWDPFFDLFEKNFPNISDVEIILSSNTKRYNHKTLNIKSVTHSSKDSWSKRCKASLEKAKNDVVLPLSEDFFLLSKIDKTAFIELLNLMLGNDEIHHIRLLNVGNKVKSSNFDRIDEITYDSNKRFIFSPGLWKKEVLLSYIADHENPWMAEKMGNIRSKIYKHNFYCVSKEYVDKNGQLYDTYFSGVIYKGKCPHYVVKFLKENGYTKILERGIISKAEMTEFKSNAKKNLILDFVPLSVSFLNIFKIFVKQKIKLS